MFSYWKVYWLIDSLRNSRPFWLNGKKNPCSAVYHSSPASHWVINRHWCCRTMMNKHLDKPDRCTYWLLVCISYIYLPTDASSTSCLCCFFMCWSSLFTFNDRPGLWFMGNNSWSYEYLLPSKTPSCYMDFWTSMTATKYVYNDDTRSKRVEHVLYNLISC